MRSILFVVCALVVSIAARPSAAVTFELEPVVSAAYDFAFTPLPSVPPWSAGVPAIYQIDLHVHTTDLAPNELGFAAVGFHVDWDAATDSGVGFAVNNAMVDTNGPAPGGLVEIFPPPLIPPMLPPDTYFVSTPFNLVQNFPLARVGQPGGVSHIGSLFAQWDGMSGSAILLTLDNITFAAYLTNGQTSPPISVQDVSIVIFPEPATGSLAFIGLMSLVALRRR